VQAPLRVALGCGLDREAADGADRDGLAAAGVDGAVRQRQGGQGVAQRRGRVGAAGVAASADGHAEIFAAGVSDVREGGVDLLELAGELGQEPVGGADGLGEGVAVAVVGPFQALQAGEVGVGAGLVQDPGVAGGQGLDLAVGQGGVADVLDLADVQGAAHDLRDEPGLAFDGLPQVRTRVRIT